MYKSENQNVRQAYRARPNKKNTRYYDVFLELGFDPITKKRLRTPAVKAQSEQEAKEIAAKMYVDYLNKTFIMPDSLTVSDWLETWYDTYVLGRRLSEATCRDYRWVIDYYLSKFFGKIKLQDLDALYVQRKYNEWRIVSPYSIDKREPLKAESLRHINRVFSTCLNRAVKCKKIRENILHDVVIDPDEDQQDIAVYSEEEFKELLSAIKNTDMELPVALLMDAILRRSELLALTWNCVDWKKGTLTIKSGFIEGISGAVVSKVKTKFSNRTVTLTEYTMKLLRNQFLIYQQDKWKDSFSDNNLIIYQTGNKRFGEPYLPKSFSRKFQRTLKKNHLKQIRLHSTRHSAITFLNSQNVPLAAIKARCGHSPKSPLTQSVYSHNTEKDQLKATQLLEASWFGNAINQ
jgi:integrase